MKAISVNNLGKKFKLFSTSGGRFLEYLSAGKLKQHIDYWALQDITFEIPAGTTLGILGQNGSGKSTLLSILAGVLDPSSGSFEINGKVSAILELGSGFHMEFSGRDNVYMYGSIMGLSKQEIDERFNEIVRFSELGDFINQPLRTYSSGMIVRLAFSVAVNVDADILIADEALAVGDALFQHRCFRKIREMQEAGKTILYVGHDTEAVRNLCTSALLLDGGRIIERGDPNTVVNKYNALIIERERAYFEGNLIEHGEMPKDCQTVYDFIQNISEARIEGAKGIPVQPQTVEIMSTPRRVILAHPPSKINYTVMVEPQSSLAFAIGILPAVWDKIPQGVKFDIEISSDEITEIVFSRVLQPKRNIGDRGWHNFLFPLDKYSGKIVSITFVTSGSGEDLSYCWSAWGWGKMIKLHECAIKTISHINPEDKSNNIDICHELPELSDSKVRIGNKKAIITKVEVCDTEGHEKLTFNSGDMVVIKTHIFFNQRIENNLNVGCVIKGRYSEIFGTNTLWENIELGQKNPGDAITVVFSLNAKLATGIYSVTSGCSIIHSDGEVEVLDRYFDCIFFRIHAQKKMVGIVDLNATVEVFNN